MAQITEAVRCRGLAPLPCRMSLWELRKRSDAFSAVRPMQQSDLTTCATCSRVWVSRGAFGAVTICFGRVAWKRKSICSGLYEREAVPGQTGPVGDPEGKAGA